MCGAAEKRRPIITGLIESSVNHVSNSARVPVHEQQIRPVADPDISRWRGEKSKRSPVGPIIIVRQENVRKDRSDAPAAIAVAARIMVDRPANSMVARGPVSRPIDRSVRDGLDRRPPRGRPIGPVRDGLNGWPAVVRPIGPMGPVRLNRLDGRPLVAWPVSVPGPPALIMACPVLLLVRSVCVTAVVLLLLRRCSGGN